MLFNIFFENIMLETLHNCHISISIGGRSICILRFAGRPVQVLLPNISSDKRLTFAIVII